MEENQDLFYQLLHRRLTGEINQSEELEFQKLMHATPENELLFHRMEDVYLKGVFSPRVKGQKSTFDRLSNQLDFEEGVSYETFKRKSRIWRKRYFVVAIFIFLLTTASIFYLSTSESNVQQEVAKSEMIQKVNPAGQKARINLPDGSVCWLNSESEIQFLSNFSDSSRNIYLRGEAYFEVAKDKNRPFRVHAPSMTITALGTVFNVNSFPDESMEMVTLIEGKISVRCEDTFYGEVLPGVAIGYDKHVNISDKFEVNPIEAIGWKSGVLNFDDETYETVFFKLERWYGVKITTSGHIPVDLKYKASFQNELLTNVLESMRYGEKFDFKIDGKNVEIKFN